MVLPAFCLTNHQMRPRFLRLRVSNMILPLSTELPTTRQTHHASRGTPCACRSAALECRECPHWPRASANSAYSCRCVWQSRWGAIRHCRDLHAALTPLTQGLLKVSKPPSVLRLARLSMRWHRVQRCVRLTQNEGFRCAGHDLVVAYGQLVCDCPPLHITAHHMYVIAR